jgi:uncharacterized OsmC-like protein
MASTVHAIYEDRKRIIFEARGRSIVNVRTMLDDGPIGYTSTELLLIALGNCTLGALLNSPALKEAPVSHAEATLEAEMAQFPTRVASIRSAIIVEVEDAAFLALQDEIQAIACDCPICNTISGTVDIDASVELRMKREPASV